MKLQLFFKPTTQTATIYMVAAVLAAGVATTYLALRYLSGVTTTAAVSAANQNTIKAVSASGYLEPKGEVIKLSAPVSSEGARIDKLLVEQGEKVEVGQVIATLNSHDRLKAALEQAQQQALVAQAKLIQVQAGAKSGDINAQAARFQQNRAELEGQIATQQATIAQLKAKLEGDRSAQTATVARAKAELDNAKIECKRYEALYQGGAVSASQRDSICLKQSTSEESLREAEASLSRIVGTGQEDVNGAVANLNRTVATLQDQLTENNALLNSVAEVRPVDVQVAQAELKAAVATAKQAEAEYEQSLVRSPQAAQILKIYARPGELVGNDGIVDIGQTGQMYARAEVYETDISRVKVGQPATVRASNIVEELHGIVDEVGLQIGRKNVLGTDPVADADSRVVDVKIRLLPEDSQRVAGLSNLEVDVLIDTSTN
jgi:HlyD family secretion protein